MKDILAKLIAALKGLGLPADKEAEATKVLEDQLKAATTTPGPTPPVATIDPQITQLLQQLKDENAALMKAFNEEKTARDASVRRLQEQAQQQRAKEIGEKLDSAIKLGRIPPADRDKWSKRLEKEFETVSEVLEAIPANPALAKQQQQTGKEGKQQEGKTNNTPPPTPGSDYLANRASYIEAAKAEFASTVN